MLTLDPNELPRKHKCIHVVRTPDYHPKMCAITIPNLQRYAKRIGADFNIISERKFPEWPVNYERLQIREAGRDYLWNINLDADTILHKEFEDPTLRLDPATVASLYSIELKHYFRWNRYFERVKHGRGIADQFVITSYLTHDIWTPLDISYEEARRLCLVDSRQVSEYCLSLNMCKFGIKLDGAALNHNKFYSVMATDRGIKQPENLIIAKLLEWGEDEFLRSTGVTPP